MKNFIYENSTKVYFGQGCVREFLTSLVKDYDTVMMAYGQGSVKRNGIYDEILNILMKAGKNVVEFSGIMPNPTYSKVMEGAGWPGAAVYSLSSELEAVQSWTAVRRFLLRLAVKKSRGRITGSEKALLIFPHSRRRDRHTGRNRK